MVSKIEEFKGHKILKLLEKEEDKFGLSFGKRKAKLILQHIKEIEEFAGDEDADTY